MIALTAEDFIYLALLVAFTGYLAVAAFIAEQLED